MADAAKVRHVLRLLLREVRVQHTSRNGNKAWRDYVVQQYRVHQRESDPAKVARLRHDAADLAVLLHSNRRHDELIKYYNPPLNDAEMVAKTARRVGLGLPKLETDEVLNAEANKAGS